MHFFFLGTLRDNYTSFVHVKKCYIYAYAFKKIIIFICTGTDTLSTNHGLYRGSYMSANILLNLLNKFKNRDKM